MAVTTLTDINPETTLNILDDSPAQAGLFLSDLGLPRVVQESAVVPNSDIWNFSRGFWLENYDLLPEGSGVVLQADIDESDNFTTQDNRNGVLTLIFDARDMATNGEFRWEVTRTFPSYRIICQSLSDKKKHMANCLRYDAQGRCSDDLGLPEPTTTELASYLITLAECEPVRGRMTKLRMQKQTAQANLAQYSVSKLRWLSDVKYQKELKTREEGLDRIGFVALKPTKSNLFIR